MTLHHSLVLEMAAFLAWNSVTAAPTVLGVVLGADRAHLNSGALSEGATVYDGDHFSTEAGGMLRLRGNAATLELAGESTVIVRSGASSAQSTEAELSKGTLVFRTTRAAALEIAAQEALIRPAGDARTIGQVSIIGPKELHIYARRGSMQFSYRGEMQTIAEGEFYRVILDLSEDATKKKDAVNPAGRGKAFLFVAIGGGGAGGVGVFFRHRRES